VALKLGKAFENTREFWLNMQQMMNMEGEKASKIVSDKDIG